jgi:DnaK suppressor protein
MAIDLMRLRNKLLQRREEIVQEFRRVEGDWQALLGERNSELEEETQKLVITSHYDQLEEREKQEMADIDLALNKMVLGTFGSCDNCGRPIAEERLEALPSSRLCTKCTGRAEKSRERLAPAAEIMGRLDLPPDFQGLEPEEIIESVLEFLQEDGQVNLEELELRIEETTLYLEGTIPSEPERQILMRILTEELGFQAIVDHLWVSDLPWEREDRTPGTITPGDPFEERIFREAERTSEDIFESQDEEMPYTPPEGPPPEKR